MSIILIIQRLIKRLSTILKLYDANFNSDILDLQEKKIGSLYVLHLAGKTHHFNDVYDATLQIRKGDLLFTRRYFDAQIVNLDLDFFLYELYK